MDILYYLFIILGFLAAVLFIEGVFLTWNAYLGPEAKRIEKRLRILSAGGSSENSSIVKQHLLSKTAWLEKILPQIPRIHVLDRLLVQSGLKWNVAIFMGLTLLAFFIGYFLSVLVNISGFFAIIVALVFSAFPWMYVRRTRRKRLVQIDQQLPDALDLISRAMLAGHAFPSALKMVGEECPVPVASEFATIFDEINYGISVQDALVNMTTRVPSTDLRYFVICVLIQRDTGGNLSELLANISALIRARQKLIGYVRVLSAEGRTSAWVLSLMPFVLAFIIHMLNPQFLKVLWTDPIGPTLTGTVLCLMILGIYWVRRVIRIHI